LLKPQDYFAEITIFVGSHSRSLSINVANPQIETDVCVARFIIRAKRYRDQRELVKKGVISEPAYIRIDGRVTANPLSWKAERKRLPSGQRGGA
jgi:ribosomal protein S8E